MYRREVRGSAAAAAAFDGAGPCSNAPAARADREKTAAQRAVRKQTQQEDDRLMYPLLPCDNSGTTLLKPRSRIVRVWPTFCSKEAG